MIQPNKKPNRILIFNPLKKLVGIYNSIHATARSFNVNMQSIHYACNGTCMSCQGHYFRQLYDGIEVTYKDLGILTVTEYDKLCGVERKVYATKTMSRKGMKYNKKPKKSNQLTT